MFLRLRTLLITTLFVPGSLSEAQGANPFTTYELTSRELAFLNAAAKKYTGRACVASAVRETNKTTRTIKADYAAQERVNKMLTRPGTSTGMGWASSSSYWVLEDSRTLKQFNLYIQRQGMIERYLCYTQVPQ